MATGRDTCLAGDSSDPTALAEERINDRFIVSSRCVLGFIM